MGTPQSRDREAPPGECAPPPPETAQGGAARTQVSPDWITAALRQTWSEFGAFARTAVDFVGHPARFGRRWTDPGTRGQNPLGFAATSFALVGSAGTCVAWLILPASSESESVGVELLSWLLPYAYAMLTETGQDAARSLERQPAFGTIPLYMPRTLGDADIGRTLFLAERTAEALPYLRRAARSCLAVESPFEHVRVHVVLGDALAKIGARDEACAAYAVVEARWGHAKPRSVTAERARACAGELGCGR